MALKNEVDVKASTRLTKQGETKIHLAICGGIFATCGSLFGKLVGVAELSFVEPLLLKGLLLVLMVVFNTIGCMLVVKALNGSESSVPVTVASTTTSYLCSAFVGLLIFGETTSLTWLCGTSLVILGLFLVCYTSGKEDYTSPERKLKHQ